MITTLHIKTDKKIKDQAEKLAKSNGITITALVNIVLRQALRSSISLSNHTAQEENREDILKRFVGSMKGRIKEDPAKWQKRIRALDERKLS